MKYKIVYFKLTAKRDFVTIEITIVCCTLLLVLVLKMNLKTIVRHLNLKKVHQMISCKTQNYLLLRQSSHRVAVFFLDIYVPVKSEVCFWLFFSGSFFFADLSRNNGILLAESPFVCWSKQRKKEPVEKNQ